MIVRWPRSGIVQRFAHVMANRSTRLRKVKTSCWKNPMGPRDTEGQSHEARDGGCEGVAMGHIL